MTSRPLNIFVVGLDDFHLGQLKTLPGAGDYWFHPLFTHRQIKEADHFPVSELLDEGVAQLKAFPGRVDAVIGYWDFPVSTVLPLLRQSVGLPSSSLESVLKCEHKYWSRLVQREVIPAHIPAFAALNPFADDPLAGVPIGYPFWLKPVKSVLSYLGFRVADQAGLQRAIRDIRAGIGRFAVPFNLILEQIERPAEIRAVDGFHCIAESIISKGRQCTLEGYSWQGEVVVYGVVDSLREGPEGSSFSRYQYPSTLPQGVVDRMTELCRLVVQRTGYDNAPFNIEFFWDEDADQIWLLEINTRISKSHAPLFYMVDGCYHHQVNVDLGLGRRPHFPHREGRYRYAAKFMLRHYGDALVTRVPGVTDLENLLDREPDTMIQIAVEEGARLSALKYQDSYSYEVATIFIGADDEKTLEQKYHRILDRMPLEFDPIESQEQGAHGGAR